MPALENLQFLIAYDVDHSTMAYWLPTMFRFWTPAVDDHMETWPYDTVCTPTL